MTQRATLRQKDLERLIKAAENTNSFVRIDMKTLVAAVLPLSEMTEDERLAATRGFENDGTGGWNSQTELPDDFAL
jgi:hypothetical protein